MRDNRTLEMSYQSFWNDTPRAFEVAPYCVKVFRQRWYVVACSASDDRLRIYALDRIRELRTSEHLFVLPEDRIRVRVSGIQRQYLRTLPLHASQQETEIMDSSSVFEFYLRPTFDFEQELLTHAANTDGQIEVLQPQWLREEMKQIGLNLVEAHKTVGRKQ